MTSVGNVTLKTDIFKLFRLLRHAYGTYFTANVILSAFAAAGICLLNRSVHFSAPLSRDFGNNYEVMGTAALEKLYVQKCTTDYNRIIGKSRIEMCRGYVDSTRGIVLTSEAALEESRTQTSK